MRDCVEYVLSVGKKGKVRKTRCVMGKYIWNCGKQRREKERLGGRRDRRNSRKRKRRQRSSRTLEEEEGKRGNIIERKKIQNLEVFQSIEGGEGCKLSLCWTNQGRLYVNISHQGRLLEFKKSRKLCINCRYHIVTEVKTRVKFRFRLKIFGNYTANGGK